MATKQTQSSETKKTQTEASAPITDWAAALRRGIAMWDAVQRRELERFGKSLADGLALAGQLQQRALIEAQSWLDLSRELVEAGLGHAEAAAAASWKAS